LANLKDPELILPQNTLLAFNPSFTGGLLKSRFEMNYRNQWTGTNQASQELNISYDNYSYGLRGGVGVLVNAQDYGMGQFGDYNLSLLYSPKLVVNRYTTIEPSVKLTMGSLIANGSNLTPDSDFEMDRGRVLQVGSSNQLNGVSRQWYKDYGLGIMLNTKWFYAGFNADNLNGHYENVYGNDLSSPTKTPIKLSAVIGTDYPSKKKTMILSPFLAYQQSGAQPEFWGGLNYRQGFFMIGGAMSTKQEFTASVGMKFKGFKMVYHYDYTESLLTQNRMGSHNIGVRFNAKSKTQRLTH
jgi:type IX secretion system PorP/SprF family membrane protein